MSKWVETRLGELININPETLSVSKYNGEIEYIDIASVNSGRLEGYTTYEVTEAPSRARRIIKNNDIIFSTVRPNLKAYYYVKNCPQNAICSTGFAVLRAKKGVNSRFVYSLVTENSFVDYLSLVAKGSAYPAVDTNDFKKAKIYVPDLPTQEKIADVLSAYDDLIEANNRRIELLEQTAQDLYKEWFVRLRFPGHENVKFENGLPEGWKYGKFKDELNYNTGKLDSNAAVPDGEYSFYTCAKTVNKTNTYCFDGECVLLGGNNATGDFSLFYANEKLDAYQRTYIVTSQNPLLSCAYIYFVLKDYLLQFKTASIGATTKFLTKGMLDKAKILVPDERTILRYNGITKSMFEQIVSLKEKNENLVAQRDMLLPRLMSGKLEV